MAWVSRNRNYNPEHRRARSPASAGWSKASGSTSCRRCPRAAQAVRSTARRDARTSSRRSTCSTGSRRQLNASADDQHGLLGDRGRRPPGEPHALQPVLSGKRDFFLHDADSLRVRPHRRRQQRRRPNERRDGSSEPGERAAVLLAALRAQRDRRARRPRRRRARSAAGSGASRSVTLLVRQDEFGGRRGERRLRRPRDGRTCSTRSSVGMIVTDGDPNSDARQLAVRASTSAI